MESKIEATDRLRAEGRWNEASAYRDKYRASMRAQGMSRADANDAAWKAMMEKFPRTEPITLESIDLPDLNGSEANAGDWVRDVMWTYDHLGRNNTPANDAPSSGAWFMLQWARNNQNRFFDSILPKAISVTEKRGDGRPGFENQDRVIFEHMDRLLAEMQNEFVENLNSFSRLFARRLLECLEQQGCGQQIATYLRLNLEPTIARLLESDEEISRVLNYMS